MFGSSGFGNSSFGGTPAFGQQATQNQNQGSMFGQGSNTFGGFGQQANTGFGSTSTFGQPQQQSSGFGGSTGAFGGTSTTFGSQPQQQPGFGSGGLFGSNTSAPASNTSFGFGNTTSAAPATPAFGSATNTGGVFGQSSNTGNAFGTTTGGLFGNTNTANTTTGAFGAGTSGFGGGMTNTGNGTSSPAYSVTQEKDSSTGVITLLQSISAMPAYRNYSFEELRVQDYQQGRKTAGQTGTTGNTFGSTNTTGFGGSTFGNTNTTGFGATPTSTGTSLFGNNTQSTGFGQSSTGFGNASTPSFGTSAPSTGLFGSTATTTATSPFGQSTNTSGFGNTTSPFGQNTNNNTGFGTGTSFGNNTAKPTFGFGSTNTNTTPTSTFGATTSPFGNTNTNQSTGFGFGGTSTATTTPAFGSTNTNSGFGFNAATSTAPATSTPSFGFGNTASSSFGAAKPATNSFSFGTNTNNNGTTLTKPSFGGFGTTTSTTTTTPSLFGNTNTSSTPSLFGNTSTSATTTPSLFGNTPSTVTSNPFGTSTAASGTTTGSSLFAPKPTLTGSSLFGNTSNTGTGLGSFGSNNSVGGLSTLSTAAPGTASVNQSGLQAAIDKNPYGNNPLFSSLPASSSSLPAAPLRSSVAVENVTSNAQSAPKKKIGSTLHFKSAPRSVAKIKLRGFNSQSPLRSSTPNSNSVSETGTNDPLLSPETYTPNSSVKRLSIARSTPTTPLKDIQPDKIVGNHSPLNDLSHTPKNGNSDHVLHLSTTPQKSPAQPISSTRLNESVRSYGDESLTSTISDGEYWISPSLSELKKMTPGQLKRVEDFEVGRTGYGKVRFLEPVDLTDIPSLDSIPGEIIIFEKKVCIVFPDESTKPPPGKGLNVPAVVTLSNCWPIDKATRQPIKDMKNPKLQQHVKKLKAMAETQFLDFNYETATWSFMVNNF